MKNKKNILITIGVIILICVIGVVIWLCFLKDNESDIKTDAVRFKESYESLNNTVRESDGADYNNVSIPEDNPYVFVSASEAARIIRAERGVIYIGANWCPWCRNAVPVLMDAAKKNKVNKIYYVDLTKYRNVWEVKDGELVKTTKEKEGYYDLLNALDEVLGEETYKVKGSDGTTYDTKEKRIYMPLVLSVKGGKIMSSHVGTVTLNEDQNKYSPLTKEQTSELLDVYDKLVKSSLPDELCDEACD